MSINQLRKDGTSEADLLGLHSSEKEDGSGRELAGDGFRKRLNALATEHGSIEALARACGMKGSTLRKWIDGPSEPNRARLVAIAQGAKVSVAWLATGEGPREPASSSVAPAVARGGGTEATESRSMEEEDVRIFFGVVSAVQRLEGRIPEPIKAEVAVRMRHALAVMARDQDHQVRLDQDDLDQLARIAQKLL